MMFIIRELGTDSFQEKQDQIFALKCDDPWFPGKKIYYCKAGSAEYMKANFPQVEDFCRIHNSGSQKIVVNNEDYYDQPTIIGASANFFTFFSYKLLSNNPETVLESINNIVISDELARKYFGSEDVLGKIIEIVNRDKTDKLVISGIFKKPSRILSWPSTWCDGLEKQTADVISGFQGSQNRPNWKNSFQKKRNLFRLSILVLPFHIILSPYVKLILIRHVNQPLKPAGILQTYGLP